MAINGIRDGETLPHTELQTLFGFKNVRNFKDFVADFDVPYTPIGYVWWIAAEDLRQALRHRAQSHADHRERRADEQAKQGQGAKPKAVGRKAK